jgi:hypothetical protein
MNTLSIHSRGVTPRKLGATPRNRGVTPHCHASPSSTSLCSGADVSGSLLLVRDSTVAGAVVGWHGRLAGWISNNVLMARQGGDSFTRQIFFATCYIRIDDARKNRLNAM